MKEREVQDHNKLTWKCVQAFTGTNGEAAKAAAELTENGKTVDVVCTPSGGAQTVRLKLPLEWHDQISDDELLSAISSSR